MLANVAFLLLGRKGSEIRILREFLSFTLLRDVRIYGDFNIYEFKKGWMTR